MMRTLVVVAVLLVVALVCSVDARKTRCERQREKMLETASWAPVCTQKGKYKRTQCDEYKCWCVTRKRGKTRFGDFIIPTGEEYDCKEEPSACIRARFSAISTSNDYIPECKADGSFVEKQCSGTGEAYTENVAKGKTSVQMNTAWGGASSRALDGNANPNYFSNSCTHTDINQGSWWAVDLGQTRNVAMVKITNRGDCCSHRLNNFYVGLSDEHPSSAAPTVDNQRVCAHIPEALKASETRSIECQGSGRFLSIFLGGKEALTLCEVQVFEADSECFCVDPITGTEIPDTRGGDDATCPEIQY